jgi:hypothetical protein
MKMALNGKKYFEECTVLLKHKPITWARVSKKKVTK